METAAGIRGRVLLGAAVIALSTGVAAIPATGATAQAADPTVDASAEKPKKRARLISKKALEAVRALEMLEPRAQRRWPGSFGGLWLEKGKVFIAFTGRANRKVGKLGRGFPKRKRLRAVRVDDSLIALRQLQAQMITDRALNPVALTEPRSGRPIPLSYALEIDVMRNAVVALVHRPVTQEIAAAFAQRYGPGVLVEFAPPTEPLGLLVCTGRDNCPPNLRAGLMVEDPSAYCTAAFNVAYRSGNKTVEGLLSAAHCGNPDADVHSERSHAGYPYGEVVAEQQRGRVDAELHSVTGFIASAPWSALAPWIWISKASSQTPVSGVGTYAGLPVGASVCKSGVVTGVTCGEVLSKTFSADKATYVPNQMEFIKTSVCAKKGDSGSPLYTTFYPFRGLELKSARKSGIRRVIRKAQGILSGGDTDIPCSDPKFSTTFGHIEFVEDALGVNVITSP